MAGVQEITVAAEDIEAWVPEDDGGIAAAARDAWDHARRLDWRNFGMLTNTLDILSRPTLKNWWYNRELVAQELPRAVKSFYEDPDAMNDFQKRSPEDGYVSTPEDGALAGFTEHGRLSAFLHPHTGFTHQAPYFETGSGPLNGAKPREGGFFGVVRDGDVTWLWEDVFAHEMTGRPHEGMVEIDYAPRDAPRTRHAAAEGVPGVDERMADVAAEETAYVVPGTETVVRDLTLEHRGEDPIDHIIYYSQLNANDRPQYLPGVTNRNVLEAGEDLVWDDQESDTTLRVWTDADVAWSGGAEAPLDRFFEEASSVTVGDYLAGALAVPVDLDPGEETTLSVFMTGVEDAPTLAGDRDRRQDAVRERWAEYMDEVDPSVVDDRLADQYERSVAGAMMLYDPESGSISAAPNFVPQYYPSWPRDAAFVAKALARAGKDEIAQDYLARFCESVQRPDGSYQQCYFSTGDAAGVIPRENDQQSIVVHTAREVYERTGDEAFLADVLPVVENALDYMEQELVDNDLLRATHDYAEMWADARQSLWQNVWAYRAFHDGAALLAAAGKDADRARAMADRVGDAVEAQFFAPAEDGFYTERTVAGGENSGNALEVAAAIDTGWADDYDRTAELVDALEDFHEPETGSWLPRDLYRAAILAGEQTYAPAGAEIDRLRQETLPGGTLVEGLDEYGNQEFAALGWANAKFLMAAEAYAGRHA